MNPVARSLIIMVAAIAAAAVAATVLLKHPIML